MRLGELARHVNLLPEAPVLVVDVISLNIADEPSKCPFCFVVVLVHAKPHLASAKLVRHTVTRTDPEIRE